MFDVCSAHVFWQNHHRLASQREERARAALQQDNWDLTQSAMRCGVCLGFLVCVLFGFVLGGMLKRRSINVCESCRLHRFVHRFVLLLLGLIVTETGHRIEKGKTVFGHYLGKWRPARVAKLTGMLQFLFALYGCFPAHFVFGLFFSVRQLERWFDRTGRDLSMIILFIAFYVGHWWQGRLGEGVGLFALFLGFIISTVEPRS